MTGSNLEANANPRPEVLSLAIEPFVKAAHASDLPAATLSLLPRAANQQTIEFFAELKRRMSRAAKLLEMPAAGANPARVGHWLETRSPHICLVFSSLTERGPPSP